MAHPVIIIFHSTACLYYRYFKNFTHLRTNWANNFRQLAYLFELGMQKLRYICFIFKYCRHFSTVLPTLLDFFLNHIIGYLGTICICEIMCECMVRICSTKHLCCLKLPKQVLKVNNFIKISVFLWVKVDICEHVHTHIEYVNSLKQTF